jgi:glycosyltransferase involved in cell wall biosynthesis
MRGREEPTPSPKVSIGMPVYNAGRYIREALDSLLAQTFASFEISISDNASTEGIKATCLEYSAQDLRLRYVRQGDNIGAMANFQSVLNEARSKYLMWYALPRYLVDNANS